MTISKFLISALALFALTFLVPFPALANQPDQLPRNEVIEKVACKADSKQSYSLYLPAQYSPEKKWPILYAFDPAARGKLPVSLFKDAAEKFGFIVVGSNNSRNGIAVSEIVKTLWDDTHARFSIDERRVYTAGFSGGDRIAVAVGSVYPVAGVIACGGGFPESAAPTSSAPFVFFGTAGTEDFNFPEMQQLKRKLEATNELYQAYDKYDALVVELKGLRNVSEAQAIAERLRNSKEIKLALIPPTLEIAGEIRPKDAQVFYDLAVAYSRVGSKTKAVSALSRAIENGFTDLAQIEQNQNFASLQNEAGYQKLVTGLKKRL